MMKEYRWWEKLLIVLAVAVLMWRALFPFEPLTSGDITIMTTGDETLSTIHIEDTGSMRPLIRYGGAEAVVKDVKSIDELNIGNILVVESPYGSGRIAHRLVDIRGNTLTLKGDSSQALEFIDFDNRTEILKVQVLISI